MANVSSFLKKSKNIIYSFIYFKEKTQFVQRANYVRQICWILVHRAAQNTLQINCVKKLIWLNSESFNVQLKSLILNSIYGQSKNKVKMHTALILWVLYNT